MPVPFEELAGSPTIEITPEGTRAQRVFRVDWADWQEFAHEVVGRYRVVGCAFVFERPLEFPDMPNLVVSDLKVEPFDPGNPDGQGVSTLVSGTNAYPAGARITAIYDTLFDADNRPRADLPGVPEGTYLTYDADLGAEYKAIPGRVWHWGPGGPQQIGRAHV